jgi:hypothetical protein
MKITANVYFTKGTSNSCILTLYEDSTLIMENVNIGAFENPDKSANTYLIKERIKEIIAARTFTKNDRAQDIKVGIDK